MDEIYAQTGTPESVPSPPERRQHRRLCVSLPVEFRRVGQPAMDLHRSVARDVSTGGIYFETMLDDLRKGDLLDIELTIPPGEGHFPYQGRVSSTAAVVRTEKLAKSAGQFSNPRIGVGAAFRQSFKLAF